MSDDADGRIRQLERDMAIAQEKLQSQASREWVRELVGPIDLAVREIKNAVTEVAGETRSLFDAHNAMLKQRAEDEKKELEAKTASGMIKRYAPVAAFILTLFTIYRVVGTVVEEWIRGLAK